jgi:serine/threonine protein kinase
MLVHKLCQSLCPEKIPVTVTNKLGDGADGEVFEYSEDLNKVIKFCILYETGNKTLKHNYKYINNVLSYLIEHPVSTYARVYAHECMGEWARDVAWKNTTQKYLIYYYLMDKLYKTSEDEKKIFHSILSHEDRGIKKNFSNEKIKEMLRGMSSGLDFDEDKVIFFVDNFKKSPVIHLDVHVRNIMKDSNGNFKMIDFDRAELRMENDNVENA